MVLVHGDTSAAMKARFAERESAALGYLATAEGVDLVAA